MELSLHYRLKCDEAADEPESVSFEKTLKVSCNISNAVNYMQQGIMEVRHPPDIVHAYLSHKTSGARR